MNEQAPGPKITDLEWKVKASIKNRAEIWAGSYLLATVYDPPTGPLLAAAPALLAALVGSLDIMEYLVDFLFSDRTEPLDAGRVREWSTQARAAIKEARGD